MNTFTIHRYYWFRSKKGRSDGLIPFFRIFTQNNKTMKRILFVLFLLISISAQAQPEDPSGDPDKIETPNPKEQVKKDYGYLVRKWLLSFKRKKG